MKPFLLIGSIQHSVCLLVELFKPPRETKINQFFSMSRFLILMIFKVKLFYYQVVFVVNPFHTGTEGGGRRQCTMISRSETSI